MKTKSAKNSEVRTVLIGMIVDKQVVAKISSVWKKEGMFGDKMADTVAWWCVRYFRKHGGPPDKRIEVVFRSWAETARDDEVTAVENFLSSLAGQYTRLKKGVNPGFTVDVAGRLFNQTAVRQLRDAIDADLEVGKVEDAVKRTQQYHKVEIASSSTVNVLSNQQDLLDKVLDTSANQPLITYPGAAGEFFGDSLSRENFVAVLGPEKRGKSFVLLDMAWRAMSQRRKVMYFECGDLSQRQVMRRIYTRPVGRPLFPTKRDKPVKYPTVFSVEREAGQSGRSEGRVLIKHDDRHYKDSVTRDAVGKAFTKLQKEKLKSRAEDFFKLSVHPNSSLSVAAARSILSDIYHQENWTPDVVVFDYADILAPPAGFQGDSREAVNDNWKAMRRLSQELHCLVLCGTQANAASYTAGTLGMQNFSEDKRKFSHVTGMIGLNQDDTEKKDHVQRWNWLVLREEEFITSESVYVAQCLGIANPCVRSAR